MRFCGNSYGFDHTIGYSFSSGVWYHVALVRASNSLYFFVNGNLIGTRSYTGTISGGAGSALMI